MLARIARALFARKRSIADVLALPPAAPAVVALAAELDADPSAAAPVLDALRSMWADDEALDARGFTRLDRGAADREAEIAALRAADIATALRRWAESGATSASSRLLQARILWGVDKRREARARDGVKRALGRCGVECDDVDAALVLALAEDGVTVDSAAARAGIKPREARRRLARVAAQRAA